MNDILRGFSLTNPCILSLDFSHSLERSCCAGFYLKYPQITFIMKTYDIITCIYLIISLFISNILTYILISYHSSIPELKRNILTHLNTVLIITMDVCVGVQVIFYNEILIKFNISVVSQHSSVLNIWSLEPLHSNSYSVFLLSCTFPISFHCLGHQYLQDHHHFQGTGKIF